MNPKKPKLDPASLAKATIPPNLVKPAAPPPKPAMPKALADGDVLDPRATKVDPAVLSRMPGPVADATRQAAHFAEQSIQSPLNDETPLSDEDAIGSGQVTHPDAAVTPAGETPPADSTSTTKTVVDKICKACGHDNSKEDIPECTTEDKIAFMAHLTGLEFAKTYTLLGGAVEVEFRKLTVQELDAITRHLLALMRADLLAADAQEYMEAYGRHRLYLQIRRLSGRAYPEAIEFPEGLNQETNPEAKTFHVGKEGNPATVADTADHAYKTFIKNEVMQRILLQSLREFNRLITYMELNAPNPSFWKEIP